MITIDSIKTFVESLHTIPKPRLRFMFLTSSIDPIKGKGKKFQDDVTKILCGEAIIVFQTCIDNFLYFEDPESAEVVKNPKINLREEIEFALDILKKLFKAISIEKACEIDSTKLYDLLVSVFSSKVLNSYKRYGFSILLYYMLAANAKGPVLMVILVINIELSYTLC